MRIPILNKLMDGPEKRAVDRAARLLEQGKAEQAATTLTQALARSPKSEVLLLELGRVLGLCGRRAEAAAPLRTLLRTGGDARDRLLELADMGRLQGLEVGHIHDVLAEQSVREGRLAQAQQHLEKIPGEERAGYAESHRKRFESGVRSPQGRPARAAIASGLYLALAHEASGNDVAALEIYGRMMQADPAMYEKVGDRLQALSSRNYRRAPLRMEILDLHLQHGDGSQAGQEAGLILEAAPNLASALGDRLAPALEAHPDQPALRMALARARWAEGRNDEAAELLDPLMHDEEVLPRLSELLAHWRVERPDAGRIALLQAELLGRGGKGSQAVQAIFEVGAGLPAEQTVPALERILERTREARAWRMLGEVRRTSGDLDGAVEAIASLEREAPERADEGAEVLRSVLSADPAHREANHLLSRILVARGELETAVILMRHRILAEPEAAAAMTGEVEGLAAEHPRLIPLRLAAAEAWMHAGQPERAIPHLAAAATGGAGYAAQVTHRLSRVIRERPDLASQVGPLLGPLEGALADPAALPFLRAELAAASGDPDRAAELASQCCGIGGDRASGPVEGLLLDLLERHPGASGPRMMLANLLVERGRPLQAVSVVAEAPEPDPGAVSLLLERLETALAGRQVPQVHASVAQLLLFAGRPEEALSTADDLLQRTGDAAPPALHLVRASALFVRGDAAAAVAAVREGCRRDPELVARGIGILEARLENEPEDGAACQALGALRLVDGKILEGLSLLVDLAEGQRDYLPGVLEEIDALRTRLQEDPRPPLAAARLHALAGQAGPAWEAVLAAQEMGATTGQVDSLVEELLERDPDNPDVLLLAGRCRAAGDPLAACTVLERVAAIQPDRTAEVLDLLEPIAGAHPELAAPRCAAARLRLESGEPAHAFAVLQPVLRWSEVPAEAAELLERIREADPAAAGPCRAMARLHLDAARFEAALQEIEAARDASADPAELLPLLARVVEADASSRSLLLRAAVRVELGELDGAVHDLDAAAGAGSPEEALAVAESLLETRPEHGEARRLHFRLLREAGRPDAASDSLDAGIEATSNRGDRCELLVERAELRRSSGRDPEAARDLREAEELAEDRSAFLGRLHRRHLRRLEERVLRASPAERIRILLELGRLPEAEAALQDGGLEPDEARALRASLLLARGETASGLQLMRAALPTAFLVDVAQRCDRPGLALAAVDRLLEAGEAPALRRARSRLVRDVWRRELDDMRVALVARAPFVPRSEDRD